MSTPTAVSKRAGQGPREPPRTAAEVERAPVLQRCAELRDRPHHLPDFVLPGGQELAAIPAAAPFVGPSQHGPERIDLRELLPVPLLTVERHRARTRWYAAESLEAAASSE